MSYKGLSYKLVKDTWPDLLPDIEEKEEPPVKKDKIVKKDNTPTTSSKAVDW